MKVGVLTWFRDANYGTILQALAMQEFLKSQGHAPQLIHYMPERNYTMDIRLKPMERLLRKYNYLNQQHFTRRNAAGFAKKKKTAYATIDSKCSVTDPVESEADFHRLNDWFDAFVCGSDQIWSPAWLDGRFFLDFVAPGKRKIAYAPSLGISQIPEEKIPVIAEYLKNFDWLSVREESARALLEPLAGRTVPAVCDPVFLVGQSYWKAFAGSEPKIKEHYVFYYLLRYQPEHWRAVKRFAKKHHLKLVGIPVFGRQFYSSGCEKYPFASPEEFVNYIAYADYVISDSFHATSFSILLNKPFYTFEAFSEKNTYFRNARVKSLVRKLGIQGRTVPFKSSSIPEQGAIEYNEVEKRLAPWVRDSKEFLVHALEG